MTDLDLAGAKPHPSGVAIQKRVVFAPEDVAVVRIVCKECGNDFGWHKGCVTERIPEACPSCGAEWYRQSYEFWNWVKKFLRLTRQVSNPQEEPKFSIRLEVEIEGKSQE